MCLKRREMLLSHPVDDLAELPRFVGASSTKERTNETHSCRVPLLAHRTMTNYELNSPHCRPIRPYKRRHHRESLFLSTSLRLGFSAFSLHPLSPFFPLFSFFFWYLVRHHTGLPKRQLVPRNTVLSRRAQERFPFFNDPLDIYSFVRMFHNLPTNLLLFLENNLFLSEILNINDIFSSHTVMSICNCNCIDGASYIHRSPTKFNG